MDRYERMIAGLRVVIDPTLCVAFGDCVEAAPRTLGLDADGVVEFLATDEVDRDHLLEACRACPVDALTVWDESGRQVVP